MTDQSETKAVTPIECRQVIKLHIFKGYSLIQMNPISFTTNQTLTVQYKWCCQDVCTSVENFFLELREVATLTGLLIASDLGNIGGCYASGGVCNTIEGIILWVSGNLLNLCSYKKLGNFSADVRKRHIIIHDLQSALTIKGLSTKCLITDLYNMTDQGLPVQVS